MPVAWEKVFVPFASVTALDHAFRALEPGETLVYHVGYLAIDRRGRGAWKNATPEARMLHDVAHAAMAYEQEGRAELTCRRIRPPCEGAVGFYEYLLTKRRVVDESAGCDWEKFVPAGKVALPSPDEPVRPMTWKARMLEAGECARFVDIMADHRVAQGAV